MISIGKFVFCLFLCSSISLVFCQECLKLATGNLEGYDSSKISGDYKLVLGSIGDPLALLTINCNDVTIRSHVHPRGGDNVAIYLDSADEDRSIQLQYKSHSNSSTDPVGEEIGHYELLIDEWMDFYFKTLHFSSDVLVTTICIRDEDNLDNQVFYILVLRRNKSKMTIEEVRKSLPDSIQNLSGLEKLCDAE